MTTSNGMWILDVFGGREIEKQIFMDPVKVVAKLDDTEEDDEETQRQLKVKDI